MVEPRTLQRRSEAVARVTTRHSARAGALGRAVGRRHRGRLVPSGREPDRREGDPDLAEDLDRDQEPDEQEDDTEQLAELEQLGDAEPVERVGQGRDERADRDEDRGRDAAMDAGPTTSARNAPGSEATRLTTIANGAIKRLKRNWSPGWFGSSE